MKFKLLFANFSKLLLDDLIYPIAIAFMIIFELMFNLLISNQSEVKYSSLLVLNFFMAIFLGMYFLKKDTFENKYFKQRINSYSLYVVTQILFMLIVDFVTAIISGIFGSIFSETPSANLAMFLALATTQFVATAIVFACRAQWTDHKYIATISLILVVLFSLADSNNSILIYINWILPPISNMITTFQEQSNMVALFPLILRQIIYAAILFVISGLFNKRNYLE